MLGAIAIVPSAPVLVPELAGAAAAELACLRRAVVTAAGSLPSRWVAVGAGPADARFNADSAGSFAGFGADVVVRFSPHAAETAELPLCALMAGWVRGQAQPHAHLSAHVYADGRPEHAVARGGRLRNDIERSSEQIGVLVVADGVNTLTKAAPGGYRPSDIDMQHALDDALADGDVTALTVLPAQVPGHTAFAVLAGLVGQAGPRSAHRLYRGAPYGVGYFAGVWQP